MADKRPRPARAQNARTGVGPDTAPAATDRPGRDPGGARHRRHARLQRRPDARADLSGHSPLGRGQDHPRRRRLPRRHGRHRPAAWAGRDHPPPEPRLRRQPEDLLRRRPRGRRRRRRHAPSRLPVRRDPHPRPGPAHPRWDQGPDARQSLPGRSPRRRHAALEVRQQPRAHRPSRTSPSGSTCPNTTPDSGPTAAACSRRSRTTSTATTSSSTRSW